MRTPLLVILRLKAASRISRPPTPRPQEIPTGKDTGHKTGQDNGPRHRPKTRRRASRLSPRPSQVALLLEFSVSTGPSLRQLITFLLVVPKSVQLFSLLFLTNERLKE